MKKVLFLTACAALSLISGCTGLPKKTDTAQTTIDMDGDYFYRGNKKYLLQSINRVLDADILTFQKNNLEQHNLYSRNMALALLRTKLFLAVSGLEEITESSASSKLHVQPQNDGASPIFCNRYFLRHADGEGRGALWKLADSPNRDLAENFAAIGDNTIAAGDFYLNLTGCYASIVRDLPEEKAALDEWFQKNFSMNGEDFFRKLSGNWGYLLNAGVTGEKKNLFLDLMMVIPDEDGGNLQLIRQMALLGGFPVEDHEGGLKIYELLPNGELLIEQGDKMLVAYSGSDSMVRFGEEQTGVAAASLAKLQLPEKMEGIGFFYSSEAAIPLLGRLLLPPSFDNLRQSSRFVAMNSLTLIRNEKDGIASVQYADKDFNELEFWQDAALPLTLVFDQMMRRADRLAVRERDDVEREQCLARLKTLGAALENYAKKHDGAFPTPDGRDGLEALLKDQQVDEGTFFCGSHKPDKDAKGEFFKQNLPGYYYFGALTLKSNPKLPLLADIAANHPGRVNVLFVDGTVQSFNLENPGSAKRIASFLHTVFRYPPEDFAELIRHAEKIEVK